MPRCLRTRLAKADLLDIWRHGAEDDISAADRLLDEIDERCRNHDLYPESGRARPELAESLRSSPVGRYIIFYWPVEGGIEVVRVLHGSRDVDRLFD
jgi:toxin ParE1/3/4